MSTSGNWPEMNEGRVQSVALEVRYGCSVCGASSNELCWDSDSASYLPSTQSHEDRRRWPKALARGEECNRCGGPNVIWSAASPLWNYVMRGNDINGEPRYDDLVCMPCFVLSAVEAGLPATGWRLTLDPEPDGLIHETPSGRVWDAKRFLWVRSEV